MQRLLVLRPGRALPDDAGKEEQDGKAPPLASQAGRVSARGVGAVRRPCGSPTGARLVAPLGPRRHKAVAS